LSAFKFPDEKIDKPVKVKITNIKIISFIEIFNFFVIKVMRAIDARNPGISEPINIAKVYSEMTKNLNNVMGIFEGLILIFLLQVNLINFNLLKNMNHILNHYIKIFIHKILVTVKCNY
tara:strand:- start:42 stop:398 length:357 start_codon:yes stop_codon:yes gene_type:complete